MEPSDPASRSSSTLTYVVAILGIAILLAVFWERFVLLPLNLERLGLPLALSVSGMLAAFSTGFVSRSLLARLADEQKPSPLFARDFVVGYPILGGLVFLVSLVAIRPVLSTAILVIGTLAGAAFLAKWNVAALREPGVAGTSELLALTLLISCALLAGAVAQMPAISLDETAYHLAIPRIWVNEGHVVDLPLLSHSSFPLGIESVDVLFLSILGRGGALASHFLHFFAAIATASILFEALRGRGLGKRDATIVVAAIVSTPALVITAGWSGTDWPLLGCVLVLLEGCASSSASSMAVAVAAGMLTKYTFLPFLLVLLPVAFTASVQRRHLVLASAIGALAGSLFLVRNILLRGNPFAPFLSGASPSLGGFHAGATLAETFRNYLFDGALVDDSLGVGLLCSLLLAFLWAASGLKSAADRAGFAGLLVITLLLASRLPASRLLVPYFVALIVLAAPSLGRALEGDGSFSMVPRMTRALLLIASCAQFGVFVYYADSLDPMSIATGRRSEADVVHVLRSESASIESLDTLLPAGSRTLVLGTHELFAFTHTVRGGGNFDSPLVSRYLESTSLDQLRRDGFSHLAVFDRLGVGIEDRDPRVRERRTTITPAAAARLQEITGRAAALVSAPGSRLYALR